MASVKLNEPFRLTCLYPEPMLRLLGGGASKRKLGLFCYGCFRHVWDLLDEAARRVAEATERPVLEKQGRGLLTAALRDVAAGPEPTAKAQDGSGSDAAGNLGWRKRLPAAKPAGLWVVCGAEQFANARQAFAIESAVGACKPTARRAGASGRALGLSEPERQREAPAWPFAGAQARTSPHSMETSHHGTSLKRNCRFTCWAGNSFPSTST
jgi:hypothetical protein